MPCYADVFCWMNMCHSLGVLGTLTWCLNCMGSNWKVQSAISYLYQILISHWSGFLCCLCNAPVSSGANWLQCFMFQQCIQFNQPLLPAQHVYGAAEVFICSSKSVPGISNIALISNNDALVSRSCTYPINIYVWVLLMHHNGWF